MARITSDCMNGPNHLGMINSGAVGAITGDATTLVTCRGVDAIVAAFSCGSIDDEAGRASAGEAGGQRASPGKEKKKKNKHKRGGRRRANEDGDEPAVSRSDAAARRRYRKKNNRRKQ